MMGKGKWNETWTNTKNMGTGSSAKQVWVWSTSLSWLYKSSGRQRSNCSLFVQAWGSLDSLARLVHDIIGSQPLFLPSSIPIRLLQLRYFLYYLLQITLIVVLRCYYKIILKILYRRAVWCNFLNFWFLNVWIVRESLFL